MLSRGGSSVQHLVTDVHKGFPFQLFRCLDGPAAAAEVKDSRPCLRDPVAAWMLRNFPEPRDLCSERATAILSALGHQMDFDIMSIEAKHSSNRRLVVRQSVQTWPMAFAHLSADWVVKQHVLLR